MSGTDENGIEKFREKAKWLAGDNFGGSDKRTRNATATSRFHWLSVLWSVAVRASRRVAVGFRLVRTLSRRVNWLHAEWAGLGGRCSCSETSFVVGVAAGRTVHVRNRGQVFVVLLGSDARWRLVAPGLRRDLEPGVYDVLRVALEHAVVVGRHAGSGRGEACAVEPVRGSLERRVGRHAEQQNRT